MGQHCELLHEFVHDSALWLQLRYRADEALQAAVAAAVAATAAATEPAAAAGAGAAGAPIAAVGGARARSSVRFIDEQGRSAPGHPAVAAAAAAAAAAAPSVGAAAGSSEPAVEVPWGRREPLRISEFEAVRQASIDDMQARAGLGVALTLALTLTLTLSPAPTPTPTLTLTLTPTPTPTPSPSPIPNGMQARAGLKQARDYMRFDLNADMQVLP